MKISEKNGVRKYAYKLGRAPSVYVTRHWAGPLLGPCCAIVACRNKAEAAELFGIKYYLASELVKISRDEVEYDIAMENPGVIYYRSAKDPDRYNFKAHKQTRLTKSCTARVCAAKL